MNDAPAVVAAGWYLPRFRAPGGRKPVRVCNGDEDATTLAVEAALDCLSRGPSHDDAGAIEELHLAVSRPDALDTTQAQVVREALGLDPTVATAVHAGDGLAGVSALLAAIDAVTAGRIRSAMVVATEPGDGVRVPAGAVALVVGRTAGPALRVTGHRSHSDVVRPNGDGRYLDHRRSELLHALDTDPDAAVADPGVAGPLWALLHGTGPVVATGTGRAVVLEVARDPGAVPVPRGGDVDAPLEEPTEVRSSPPLSLPGGSPFFQRSARELLRLEGARCRGCGHVAFPPSQRPICPSCQGTDFEPTRISRRGTVHTYVVNRFLPAGFGAEMALVLADLDDGNRYWAPTSGIRTTELRIGAEVELRLRRFTDHGGAPVYAMKVGTR